MSVYVGLSGSKLELLPGSRLVGPVDHDQIAGLTVRVRSSGDLAALVRRVYEIARQPLAERKYLKHEELAAQYGARKEDLDAVESHAVKHSLTVVRRSAPARSISLKGKLGDLLAAFHADVQMYHHGKVSYRGRKGTIGVPEALTKIVTSVLGFDTRPLRDVLRSDDLKSDAGPGGKNGQVATDFAARYHFPDTFKGKTLDGSGQTIAFIELGGGFRRTDLDTYFQEIGKRLPKVIWLPVEPFVGNEPSTSDADGEVMMDLEVAGAVVPGAELAVYFTSGNEDSLVEGASAAVYDAIVKPSVISISGGGPEDLYDEQSISELHHIFAAAGALGITVCASTGDRGTAGQDPAEWDQKIHVEYPASDDLVLACGGTQINAKDRDVAFHDGISFKQALADEAKGKKGDEAGAGGGGISTIFKVPSYQADAKLPLSIATGKPGRGIPDIAMNVFDYFVRVDGKEGSAGGTSAVAPLMAALVARLNQGLGVRTGFLNPFLYAHAAGGVFHDVTVGVNAIKDTVRGYRAGAGWDAVTGLGTPNGAAMLKVLSNSVAVQFTDLRCIETTADQGSDHDEPYAVFVSVDLSGATPRGRVARTHVFRGVDETKAHRDRREPIRIWGIDEPTEAMSDPDKVFLLVGLMESDDSTADEVMNTAFRKTMAVADDLPKHLDRAHIVTRLRKAFNAGLLEGASTGPFDSDDDEIGNVQELRILQAELDQVNRTGKSLKKPLSFKNTDDQGKYDLHFELGIAPLRG